MVVVMMNISVHGIAPLETEEADKALVLHELLTEV